MFPIDVFDRKNVIEDVEKKYYSDFKFKHPTQMISKICRKNLWSKLRWYLTDWTQTTNTIDYGIKVTENAGQTKVVLEQNW
jgi:hypothetical protein